MQQVDSVCIGVCDRKRGIERQLAVEADRRLDDIRRPQTRADLLDCLRCLKCSERRDTRNSWKKIRVTYDILLLNDPVIAQCRDRIRKRKSVIENSKACSQYSI